MSAEYDVLLKGNQALEYLDKLIDKSERADAAIRAMQRVASSGVKIRGAAAGGGWGSSGGRAGGTADPWAQQWKAAERGQAQLLRDEQRFSAYRIKIDRSEAREKARTETQAQRLQERQARDALREEEKFSAYRIRLDRKFGKEKEREQARQAKETERAAHKPWFGGEKSIGDLFRSRASEKTKGLATRAADAVLDAPANIVSGVVSGIGALVTGTAQMAYNLGSAAVSAQAMREESVEGFKAIYGVAVDSEKLFDNARTAAKLTKLDTADVVKIYNTEAASGFSAQQLDPIFWSVADVSSARGNEKGQQYLRGLGKLNAQDNAMFGTFQQAAMAGPGLKNAEETLADKLGITDRKNLDAKLRHMFRGHEVKGSDALAAITGATTKLYDKKTGQAGEYAKAQGNFSWSGAISNIKNGLGDVLNMKLPEDHPINKFKKLLQAIGSEGGLFDQTSERGQRFEKLIGNVVADIFLPFGGVTLSNTNNILDRILDAAEALRNKFHAVMAEIAAGTNNFINNARGSLLELAADIGIAIARGIAKALPGGEYSSFAQGGGQKGNDKAWANFGADLTSSPIAPGTILGGLYGSMVSAGNSAAEHLGYLGTGEQRVALPSMDGGGVVRGDYFGQPVPILAHAGEIVSGLDGEFLPSGRGSLSGMQFGGGMGGGGGGASIGSITVPMQVVGGSGATAQEIIQEASRTLTAVIRSELTAALGMQYAGGGL